MIGELHNIGIIWLSVIIVRSNNSCRGMQMDAVCPATHNMAVGRLL